MPRIIHITAHLGGGVGNVLSAIAIQSANNRSKNTHAILTLEPTNNEHYLDICKKNNIQVYSFQQKNCNELINGFDIVQIEWWHHPLTMKFMFSNLPLLKTRLLIWSHISGCNFPCIPASFPLFPDFFIFSTPYSYENKSWSESERDFLKKNTRIVISSGLTINEKRKNQTPHSGFNIGYVGFLGYSKIHPNFVKYCESAINVPDIHFYIIGDPQFGRDLIDDVESSLVADKVTFLGYSHEVQSQLSSFDIFGYPLNPFHTGTAENALLEAMAAGVVPVVLNQCSEKYTVKHRETGMVVNSPGEYGQAITWLQQNPIERLKMADAAALDICHNYGVDSTCNSLDQVYAEILKKEKRIHSADQIFGRTPGEWFKSCYNGDLNRITGLAAGDNKAGLLQYLKYFPDDYTLLNLYGHVIS